MVKQSCNTVFYKCSLQIMSVWINFNHKKILKSQNCHENKALFLFFQIHILILMHMGIFFPDYVSLRGLTVFVLPKMAFQHSKTRSKTPGDLCIAEIFVVFLLQYVLYNDKWIRISGGFTVYTVEIYLLWYLWS